VHAECARLLKQSVGYRVHNNPKPVSLLSGGIDSTIVTQTVSRLAQSDTITLASRLRLSPDERYATYAARRIGVSVQRVRISSRSVAEDVQWALSLQDEPLGMMSFFMLAHLVKSARAHGRILLTGDGGDEVFLGYGRASDWIKQPGAEKRNDHGGWTVGPETPEWMSPWGRFAVRQQLLGHMFPKVDRASAEQGVEIRSPLLDWDLMAFARMLPPSVLLRDGRMKALLKTQLTGWPEWFIERPKVGFTFRLRWLWLTSGFAGIRELVSDEAVERFRPFLPAQLRRAPHGWSTAAIFGHFKPAWKLLVWTAFERRLAEAGQLSR
jgi:asparagine synthetase B (glutamine-hydrolysing)